MLKGKLPPDSPVVPRLDETKTMLERAQTACHSSNADSNHCTMCSEVPVLMP